MPRGQLRSTDRSVSPRLDDPSAIWVRNEQRTVKRKRPLDADAVRCGSLRFAAGYTITSAPSIDSFRASSGNHWSQQVEVLYPRPMLACSNSDACAACSVGTSRSPSRIGRACAATHCGLPFDPSGASTSGFLGLHKVGPSGDRLATGEQIEHRRREPRCCDTEKRVLVSIAPPQRIRLSSVSRWS